MKKQVQRHDATVTNTICMVYFTYLVNEFPSVFVFLFCKYFGLLFGRFSSHANPRSISLSQPQIQSSFSLRVSKGSFFFWHFFVTRHLLG